MDYIEAFRNLKTNNKYSRKSPHKAILLLVIIDMYESHTIIDNVIKYDDALKSSFNKLWNKVLPNEMTFLPEAYLPFWYMQSEGFWHIVPKRGKEDILKLMRDTHVKPSEAKLLECVNYAELDDDLFFLITLQTGRSSLKRILLENYTSLSNKTIDLMSASEDISIDHSAIALDEYENILRTTTQKKSIMTGEVSHELEKEFNTLDEEIQYVLNIEYYRFLKSHVNVRDFFKEICPSVYVLYERVTKDPVHQGFFPPHISIIYENFLADLKIALMSEEGTSDIIDGINNAIQCLHEKEKVSLDHSSDNKYEGVSSSHQIMPVIKTAAYQSRPLKPTLESRKEKPWTEYEEELISLYYNQGYSIEEIAAAMGRADDTIKTRLAKLGIIEYEYDDAIARDETIVAFEDRLIGFSVDNTDNHCSIIDNKGELVFSSTGMLKIFHGIVYRFNYKEMCFTVKEIKYSSGIWEKGGKKLVAYSNTELYSILDKYDYINQIEDFVEAEYMQFNKIRVDGKWYNFVGDSID